MPGATINDVVLAIVGGALRQYLIANNELPSDPLVAMIPVSVREPGDTSAGNQVSAMFSNLGTHIPDAVERLAAIHEATSQAKAGLNAMGARRILEIAELMPGALVALASRQSSEAAANNFTNPTYNTVVTNAPGPQHTLYSLGAKLVRPYGLSLVHDGMGLMHCAQTYVGEMYLSFTVCRTMLPDPRSTRNVCVLHTTISLPPLRPRIGRSSGPRPRRRRRRVADRLPKAHQRDVSHAARSSSTRPCSGSL